MFSYQQNNRFFAQIADEMKALAVDELTELGALNITPIYRGIYFEADKAALYRINYTSRLITRVLAPLISFQCHSTKYLYKMAKAIIWTDLFSVENTFAIFANVSHSNIKHSQYAALCLKDAIVDFFREKSGKRPDIDTVSPNVWLNLHIENNRAVINFDTSGGSLHRRGYRKKTVAAPMQETLAAAIIQLSEWDGSRPLYDPMCGSGTLLCEALMYYCRIPSGILREKFGFELLPDFDRTVWNSVKRKAGQQTRDLSEGIISGSDVSKKAIETAIVNVRNLPYSEKIKFNMINFQNILKLENSIIVCNPPYGIRLKGKNLADFYKSLGDFLKQRCQGCSAYIYFGNRELIKKIGLKPLWKKPLKNGGLEGRLVKYEMY